MCVYILRKEIIIKITTTMLTKNIQLYERTFQKF